MSMLCSKEYQKKYRQTHKLEQAKYNKKYHQEHKPEQVEYSRKYYQKHKQECTETQRKYLQAFRRRVFKKLGDKCVRCGFSDVRALQIDHVNGGGNKEIRELGRSKTFYEKVLADTEGKYQLLCANCNWIKKVENNENKQKCMSLC